MAERPTLLITGAAGGIASIVVGMLVKKYRLVGVDPRPMPEGVKFPGEFFQIDYRSRRMAEVFRQYSFHAMLHLGRVALGTNAGNSARYNINVLGTRNLLDLVLKYGVKNVVVCSTFHVYGAHQHNHLHLTEDDPLRASQIFPELIDAVDMDNVTTNFVLKHPGIRTIILRPVNVVGPHIRNRITQFFRGRFCPYVLGYDPPTQFMHERDLARALKLCLESRKNGVYNVAGEGVVPFTRAIQLAGSNPVPVPHFLAFRTARAMTRIGVNFPKHLVDYFRYPVVISDVAFRKDFGYEPEINTVEALSSIRGEAANETSEGPKE